MDYRVTLDCGHTHLYRTTIHPRDRERLTCGECGDGQRAATVIDISTDQCEFLHFTRRTAWVSAAPTVQAADPSQLADAS
jgi:hypothetical protein